MDTATQKKWDDASRTFDIFAAADDRRVGPHKQRLFKQIHGDSLLVAAGTGNDFKFLPPDVRLTAIDISPKMIERAGQRPPPIQGASILRSRMSASSIIRFNVRYGRHGLTFCSVPRPVIGLRELNSVLNPGDREGNNVGHPRTRVALP